MAMARTACVEQSGASTKCCNRVGGCRANQCTSKAASLRFHARPWAIIRLSGWNVCKAALQALHAAAPIALQGISTQGMDAEGTAEHYGMGY